MPQGLFSAAPSHCVVTMPDRSDTTELPSPGRVADQELPTLFPLEGPERPTPLVLADYAGMTEIPALSRPELHRMAYGGRPAPDLSQLSEIIWSFLKLHLAAGGR